jgi:acetyl/propionyl-CoA carboxylase alpha subunit
MAYAHRLPIPDRGEVAVRIARAAAGEGMTSVAVAAADECRLPPGSAPAYYLDIAGVLAAATGAVTTPA